MDKFLGKKLDRRYEIREFIGVGGMAQVYKAYDIIDDRYVAIKILKDEYLRNDEFLRRFKNESKAIAVLSHPNIVKVYDVSFGDRIQYIVMEYINGITLKEYLEQQSVINWKEAIYFTMQILKALQHAHEKGIIHRDIKPHNIMLLNDGTIKVTDFGIARFAKSETRTMTDKAIGSVHYIAPEQARGDNTDAKSDIYSVGVMLYEMISGKLPFEADSAVSVAIMQLQTDPEPPCNINPAIPEGLQEITLRAMQKEPSKRYISAVYMIRDLEYFSNNPDIIFNYDYSVNSQPEKEQLYQDRYVQNESIDYSPNYAGEVDNSRVKLKNKKKKIIIASSVAVVMLIIASIFIYINFFAATDVELPNFVGRKYVEIMTEKNNGVYKFKFQREDGYDITKPDGEILEQNPKQTNGKKVKSNTTIVLTVNTLGDSFAVPDVTGKSKEEAMEVLKNSGLSPTAITIVDNMEKGLVVSTSPAANTATKSGESITIYVSSGPEETKISVPDVIGMSYNEAKSKIESAGLKVGTITKKDSTKEKDEVLETNPLPTTLVKSGSAVSLVLSSGAKPESTVDINVKLPNSINKDMSMTVYIDGKLNNNLTRTVNPAKSDQSSFSVTGKNGQSTITVKLDNELYYTYVVDFDKESIVTATKNPEYKADNSSTSSSN